MHEALFELNREIHEQSQVWKLLQAASEFHLVAFALGLSCGCTLTILLVAAWRYL